MNLKKDRLQFLLKLLVENSINENELEELAGLLGKSVDETVLDAELKSLWEELDSSNVKLDDHVYDNIIAHPRFSTSNTDLKSKTIKLFAQRRLIYYAAMLFLVCGIGLGYYYLNPTSDNAIIHQQLSKTNTENKNEEVEGVVLTLANGKQVVLDSVVDQENKIDFAEINLGQIIYDSAAGTNDGALTYNTISTPVGKNYQLILSDGTKVWLNAKSSLTFPVNFAGNQRHVELDGEGYFEVAHNSAKPFMVQAKNMKIQVLGTRFNVSAYADDQMVATSLVEGAVKVENENSSVLLKPNQQAVLSNQSTQIKLKNFSADEVFAWREGYFIFRNEPITEMMKKISRWYNIDVEYQGKLNKEEFGGKFLKQSSLTELLSSLELAGKVTFKVEGRKVTVMH